MAKLINGNGIIREVSPQNGKDFKLQEVYKLLDINLVDVLYLKEDLLMLIDDEGKVNDSFINREATIIAWQFGAISENDCICGKALICSDEEFL